MNGLSSRDFVIGNMADDLVNLTIKMCGKKDDNKPRFPKNLYDSFVSRIYQTVFDIHEFIFIANETRPGERRVEFQKSAASKCVYLNHLIRICTDNGWISEKQRNTWQKLVSAIKWKIVAWMKSDVLQINNMGQG